MQILKKPFGEYKTNCYILKFAESQVVLDPGVGASQWIQEQCNNVIAILNTHGHFDHIWDNSLVKRLYPKAKIFCHQKDSFLLKSDVFGLGMPLSTPDFEIQADKSSQDIELADLLITFHHFPGHTPGCCMVEINNCVFSGDFIFHGCIGRSDFAYSNAQDMRESLLRFRDIQRFENLLAYPGHGKSTRLGDEQRNVENWL